MVYEADLVSVEVAVNFLPCVEGEEVGRVLLLVDRAASIGFSVGDDLALVFAHELMLFDILASIKTHPMDSAVAEKSVFGYAFLKTGIAAPLSWISINATVHWIEQFADAARAAQVSVALSSQGVAGASAVIIANKAAWFFGCCRTGASFELSSAVV